MPVKTNRLVRCARGGIHLACLLGVACGGAVAGRTTADDAGGTTLVIGDDAAARGASEAGTGLADASVGGPDSEADALAADRHGGDADAEGDATARAMLAAAVAIASDSTGMKLVVVGGGIWTSTNGGVMWIDQTPSGPAHIQQWRSVASDATGMNLVAVVNGFYDAPDEDAAAFSGDVWTSTDSGVTWTDQTASSAAHGHVWRSVASDSSGTYLVAVASGSIGTDGAIWTSTNAGVSWTN